MSRVPRSPAFGHGLSFQLHLGSDCYVQKSALCAFDIHKPRCATYLTDIILSLFKFNFFSLRKKKTNLTAPNDSRKLAGLHLIILVH